MNPDYSVQSPSESIADSANLSQSESSLKKLKELEDSDLEFEDTVQENNDVNADLADEEDDYLDDQIEDDHCEVYYDLDDVETCTDINALSLDVPCTSANADATGESSSSDGLEKLLLKQKM